MEYLDEMITFETDCCEDKQPLRKTYYHATEEKNFDSILEKGILKGIDGVVYVCEKPEEAARFLAIRGIKTIFVFEVHIEESFISESFDHNERFFRCKAYMYSKDILREEIVGCSKYELP